MDFDTIKKEVQNNLIKDYRKYFKKSRFLLTKRFDKFTYEQKQQVNIMLYVSPSLSTAHFYKEEFLKILDCKDHDSAKKKMSEWIDSAFDCGLPRFKKCAETMINWTTGVSLTLSQVLLQTLLPRAVTTKSKFLNVTLTVTRILIDFAIVFFICLLTKILITTNKRQLSSHRLFYTMILFFCVISTISPVLF